MTHEFLILHFAGQCPWLSWTIEQSRIAAAEVGGEVSVVDVASDPAVAERHRLYFPFLTIIDGRVRVSAPVPAASLIGMARDSAPVIGVDTTEPESGMASEETSVDRIEPLTVSNIAVGCTLCGAPAVSHCGPKCDWAAQVAARVPAGILGYVGYFAGQPAAAVEVLPASLIPYPLPEPRTGTAFITCIYPTRVPDHRGAVLDRLLAELPALGYERALVVAGRRTPFPNGPATFFRRHGFGELVTLTTERLNDASEELVLMEYVL